MGRFAFKAATATFAALTMAGLMTAVAPVFAQSAGATTPSSTGITYGGDAYAVGLSNVKLLGSPIGNGALLGDTGPLPPTGGTVTSALGPISVGGLLSATVTGGTVIGAGGATNASEKVAGLGLLNLTCSLVGAIGSSSLPLLGSALNSLTGPGGLLSGVTGPNGLVGGLLGGLTGCNNTGGTGSLLSGSGGLLGGSGGLLGGLLGGGSGGGGLLNGILSTSARPAYKTDGLLGGSGSCGILSGLFGCTTGNTGSNNPTSGSGSSGGGNTTGSNSGSTNLVASGCNNLLGCVVNLGLIQTSAGAAAPGVVPPTGGEAYPYEDGNLGTIELLGGAVNVPLNDGPNTVINLGILSITLNQQSYDPTTNTASNQGVVLNFPDTGLLSAILSGTITVSSSTASTSGTLSCPPGVSLTSISPTSGPIAGGTTVTLTGTNFAAGAPVAFGSNPATNIDVVNSTTITAKSPRGLKGPALVTVYNCPSTSDFTYTGSPVMRFGGGNRIQTAIAVSKGAYPATGSAGGVVLASDLDFTDGLAGVPLASQKDAPLLLTEPTNERNGINPEVLTEIQRVLTPHANKPVYIIGGYGTLAKSIDSTLSGLGYNPIRIAGSNAPATAVAAAHAQGNPNTVFLVTDTNFADALSAGPAAIKQNGTVLFTNGPNMAPETRTYLNAHPGDAVFAVGGPAASADRQATPIVGADEFATDTLVAAFFGNPTVIGVARGDLFPDALDGGTMVATDGGPIILVNPDVPIPSASQAYFVKEKPYIQMVNVYGGTGAVSDAVVSDINADLGT